MKSKQANEVVHVLKERVFQVFGLLYILHSDNGRKFVNNDCGYYRAIDWRM